MCRRCNPFNQVAEIPPPNKVADTMDPQGMETPPLVKQVATAGRPITADRTRPHLPAPATDPLARRTLPPTVKDHRPDIRRLRIAATGIHSLLSKLTHHLRAGLRTHLHLPHRITASR